MHQPKRNSKQLIQHLHAASAYFTSPAAGRCFPGQFPSTKLPKRQQCFFKGLGFHNLQSCRESSTRENPEPVYMGQAAFLQLTHTAGTSCWKEEIWEAGFGLQNHLTVPKKLTKKKHVHICLKTSLYKCLYIHTVTCSTGSLFHIMGKNNNYSLLSTFPSIAEQELVYLIYSDFKLKLQLWTHKTSRVLCRKNQKCNSQS